METVPTIPASAWEQAVFVTLGIVFFIYVLIWLSKTKNSEQKFQSSESNKWQAFIAAQDDKWRQFNKEQRVENNDALKCVQSTLKDLITVTQELVYQVNEMRKNDSAFYEDFHAHDNQAKEILTVVQKNGVPLKSSSKTPKKEE